MRVFVRARFTVMWQILSLAFEALAVVELEDDDVA
jgi:hypothetical protein